MFNFRVVPDSGEPFSVVAGSRDVLAWEKAGPGRSVGAVLAAPTLTAFYQLAYAAASRQRLFTGTQAEFEATCELTRFDEAADAADPTQPAP
ncbi:hypothetical protein [Pseudonocardia asaccharolytica]|uniref:Uncharacterized protein n=1 Tax=Pseudonocardia asaccharolytica DSM 44247 = NBRC 16224 TaxID=1123024 RepID=A0A511CYQ5_9PSEU|nr:hypothetical protein [Pseudonocardia asaccharolytica]GEL17690.1 hypothetical protein PA7_15270 [Pseudonocardia asaccharolytica DSM 44247 = NBRC 16224]